MVLLMKFFVLLPFVLLCTSVLQAAPTPQKSSMKEWAIPQNALFFKEKANDDWFARPEKEREWLAPARLSPDVFRALDTTNTDLAFRRGGFDADSVPRELKAKREAALATWRGKIRPEWLPPTELVVTGQMHLNASGTTPERSYEVAYSSFARGDVRGLYMARPSREFWLYLEQLFPLPKGTSPLRAEDVLRAEAFPGAKNSTQEMASLAVREYVRFRAPLPVGPYQQVRILLIRVGLPAALEISNFGYRGDIKP